MYNLWYLVNLFFVLCLCRWWSTTREWSMVNARLQCSAYIQLPRRHGRPSVFTSWTLLYVTPWPGTTHGKSHWPLALDFLNHRFCPSVLLSFCPDLSPYLKLSWPWNDLMSMISAYDLSILLYLYCRKCFIFIFPGPTIRPHYLCSDQSAFATWQFYTLLLHVNLFKLCHNKLNSCFHKT